MNLNHWPITVNMIMGYIGLGVLALLALAAIAACFSIAVTRPDAFDVADRLSKFTWLGIMGMCVFGVVLSSQMSINILAWISAVVIGVYWFDIRPQIKEILGNAGGR